MGVESQPLGTGSAPILAGCEKIGIRDTARETSMDGDVKEGAKKMLEEVEARAKEGQRRMADFWQCMERLSELQKGRSR